MFLLNQKIYVRGQFGLLGQLRPGPNPTQPRYFLKEPILDWVCIVLKPNPNPRPEFPVDKSGLG